MKKKILYLTVILFVFLLLIIVFFKPLSFSDLVKENYQIIMTFNELGVRNGEPYNDYTNYQDITTEQKNVILTLLGEYTYRRTFGTLFSDGSISRSGDRILFIYAYDDDSLVKSIIVSSSGDIIVNDKNYRMKNAEMLIERINEIMRQAY